MNTVISDAFTLDLLFRGHLRFLWLIEKYGKPSCVSFLSQIASLDSTSAGVEFEDMEIAKLRGCRRVIENEVSKRHAWALTIMPALKAFGLKWRIGSDDFVFPYTLSAFIRSIW